MDDNLAESVPVTGLTSQSNAADNQSHAPHTNSSLGQATNTTLNPAAASFLPALSTMNPPFLASTSSQRGRQRFTSIRTRYGRNRMEGSNPRVDDPASSSLRNESLAAAKFERDNPGFTLVEETGRMRRASDTLPSQDLLQAATTAVARSLQTGTDSFKVKDRSSAEDSPATLSFTIRAPRNRPRIAYTDGMPLEYDDADLASHAGNTSTK
ncbi:hypothetical protein LTS18_008961, partial [Coniosporium uncinatum]